MTVAMLLAVSRALGGQPAILVLPSAGAPEESVAIALAEAGGFDVEETKDVYTFLQRVRLYAPEPGRYEDCAGELETGDLDARLGAAKKKYQTLDLTGALADFAGIDLDLPCAASPLAASFVFALDLARAEANLELSSASMTSDAEKSAFFAQEAASALDRAAVVGDGQPLPRDLDRTVRAALMSARERRERAELPRFGATGPVGAELYVNGVLVQAGGQVGIVGENLVQVVRDGELVASTKLGVRSGEPVVVDLGGLFLADGAGPVLEGLVRGPPDPQEGALLATIAAVVEADRAVAFAGWVDREPVIWLANQGSVRKIAAAPVVARRVVEPKAPPKAVPSIAAVESVVPKSVPAAPKVKTSLDPNKSKRLDRWSATAGFGVGGGWRSGSFDGAEASDGELSTGLMGRVGVLPAFAVSWAVVPTGSASSFDLAGEGVTGDVPIWIGGRWGPQTKKFAPDAGLDLGLRATTAADAVVPVQPAVNLCAGGSGATGKTSAVRFEGCAAFGDNVARLGFFIGVESRLGWD